MDDLWTLCRVGNVHNVRRLLSSYGIQYINRKDSEGNTPLFIASQFNKLDVVKLLIDNGALVNMSCEGLYTPLLIAASEGHEKVLELLLDYGSHINQANERGWTALIFACSFYHIACVQLLLARNADANLVSNTGCSALYQACSSGNKEVVSILLQQPGLNINLPSNSGFTPLHTAAEYGFADIVRLLLDVKADSSLIDSQGMRPLDLAKGGQTISEFYRRDISESVEVALETQPLLRLDFNHQYSQESVEQSIESSQQVTPSSKFEGIAANEAQTSELPQMQRNIRYISSSEQMVLNTLAQASPITISYLRQFGDEAVQAELEYSIISDQPVLFEYYVQLIRSITSAVLALQTLLSKMVVDARISRAEEIYSMLDLLSGASNIVALPIVTGIGKYLLKIPFDRERQRCVENITTFFPSVDSHKYIEIFARHMTLHCESHIKATAKAAQTGAKDGQSSIRKLLTGITWLQEAAGKFLTGEASLSPVEALAGVHAARLLEKLMSHSNPSPIGKDSILLLRSLALDRSYEDEKRLEMERNPVATYQAVFDKNRDTNNDSHTQQGGDAVLSEWSNNGACEIAVLNAGSLTEAQGRADVQLEYERRPISSGLSKEQIKALQERLSSLESQLSEDQKHSKRLDTQIVSLRKELKNLSGLQEIFHDVDLGDGQQQKSSKKTAQEALNDFFSVQSMRQGQVDDAVFKLINSVMQLQEEVEALTAASSNTSVSMQSPVTSPRELSDKSGPHSPPPKPPRQRQSTPASQLPSSSAKSSKLSSPDQAVGGCACIIS